MKAIRVGDNLSAAEFGAHGFARTVARIVVTAAFLAVFAVTGASTASAHAVLQTTTPVDGESLEQAPSEITLAFSEPVSPPPNAVRVFNADGDRIESGAASSGSDPATLTADLPEQLPDGTYVVAWRATSADGHPVQGAFIFSVGSDSAAVDRAGLLAAIVPENDAGWQVAAAITRWVLYASTLLAAGGVAFLVWAHDRHTAERAALFRIVTVATAIAAVATVAEFACQTVITSGLGARALGNGAVLRDVLLSGFGASTLVRVLGLVTLGFAVPRLWTRPAVLAAGGGALVAVGSFALTGHTVVTSPRWLVTVADLAHATAGAAWFGGLVLLLVALRRRKADEDAVGAATLVARFSAVATVAVIAVTLAGSGLAWAEVRAVRALTSTAYGWTLIAKLVLVGLVVAGGAYNNQRLVPAIKNRAQDAWGGLRRIVRLEAVGLVVTLAVTAVLVNLVPARTAAGVSGFYHTTAPMGDSHLDITVDPNRAGTNELHIYLLATNGQPTDPPGENPDLQIAFSLPAMDIGPIERTATVAGPGHWTMVGDELSIAGQWQLEVTLPLSRFEQLTAEITVPVAG